jgi:hypothetical protein
MEDSNPVKEEEDSATMNKILRRADLSLFLFIFILNTFK